MQFGAAGNSPTCYFAMFCFASRPPSFPPSLPLQSSSCELLATIGCAVSLLNCFRLLRCYGASSGTNDLKRYRTPLPTQWPCVRTEVRLHTGTLAFTGGRHVTGNISSGGPSQPATHSLENMYTCSLLFPQFNSYSAHTSRHTLAFKALYWKLSPYYSLLFHFIEEREILNNCSASLVLLLKH